MPTGAPGSAGPTPSNSPTPLAGRLEEIVQLAPIGIGVVDLEGRTVLSNDALCTMLGYSAEELAGMHYEEYSHPDDNAENQRLLDEMLAGHRERFEMDKRFFHADGSVVLGRLTVSLLRDDDGAPCLHIGMLENVTEQRRLERQVVEAEATYRTLVEDVPAVVYLYRLLPSGRAQLRYVSPYVEQMLGWPPADWVADAQLWLSRVHPDDRDEVAARAARLVDLATHTEVDAVEPSSTAFYRMRRRDGATIWIRDAARLVNDGDGRVIRGVLLDVTWEKELEARLERRALLDPLTELANRALFSDRLRHCHDRVQRGDDDGSAVLFLDLDDFKAINDALGHAAGDELLRSAADRVRRAVRQADTAARMGGDEFAVLIEGVAHRGEAELAADRVHAALSAPYRIADRTVTVTASLGIAFLADARTPEEALREADLAMYEAKRGGKAQTVVHRAD